ncbi:cytochrome c oxidase subunit 5b-like [Olea europaea subsp. europaea]|uniref:Cytochrome c oxidase subunit 5b-like n=2 Tax=Olea europaea subsp. europaea TaxID=158383 RepID=A0A8S0SDL7_OLEEU|nr:cytochrome c oxidase subunit 5b-like [Olea europaea subsp. europaea]
MWRRLFVQIRTLASTQSAPNCTRILTESLSSPAPHQVVKSLPIFYRLFSTESGNVVKRVEDVMPIATGHEREEIEAELQGKDILEIDHPSGPFGTKVSVKYFVS